MGRKRMEVMTKSNLIFFSGNWSDNSPLWTPKLKEKYKVLNRNDGVFYMSLSDYRKYFETIDFLYFRDHYKYEYRECIPELKKGIYFEIDI
jgi:calpain-15